MIIFIGKPEKLNLQPKMESLNEIDQDICRKILALEHAVSKVAISNIMIKRNEILEAVENTYKLYINRKLYINPKLL